MYKFISLKNPDNRFDITEVTFEVDTESKTDLIEEFILFLKACGFQVEDEDLDGL